MADEIKLTVMDDDDVPSWMPDAGGGWEVTQGACDACGGGIPVPANDGVPIVGTYYHRRCDPDAWQRR